MKKLALIILLFTAIQTIAQDREYKFSAFTFSDPYATLKDGVNAGVGIEYQMNVMYFKAQTFIFPDLNGITYLDVVGVPLGINIHNKFDNYRLFTGLKLGVIFRGGGPNPLAGIEAGIDVNITKQFYLGIQSSYDYRTDGRVWEAHADNYFRLSTFGKAGIRF